MSEQVIICPYCKKKIPLTEAIGHEIREELRRDFEAEFRKREEGVVGREKALKVHEAALKERAAELERTKASFGAEVERRLKAERKKFEKARGEAEKEFERRLEAEQKRHEKARIALEEEVEKKLEAERERIARELRRKIGEEREEELKALREELEEKGKKVKALQKAELALRKERQHLEEEKEAFELEVQRRIDAERKKVREEVQKKAAEDHRLKDQEKDRLIEGLKRQIDDLQRKAEQGSQQAQGEVLELDLEDFLRAHFPMDRIEPVPKGIRGADIVQRVCADSGAECGTIIWETKRTKNWSPGWIEKLKDDRGAVGADVAVLLTTVLPRDVDQFARIDGVWVTAYPSALGLVTVLRWTLIEVATARTAAVGKGEKMEMLYGYLSGPEFRQVVEAIVDSFSAMKRDLDAERSAMERLWKKREKQIERVVRNVVGMFGSMQGIIGASLPEIEKLDLKALAEGED